MSPEATTQPGGGRVYSARHAKWLLRPWRRLLQRPKRILGDLVREGATVADIGCGPGYFTLPLARMVGPAGQVVALDLQPEMLERVRQRAERAGLLDRIRFHQCRPDAIDCPAPVDGILACYIVHEVPDVSRFMAEAYGLLRAGGRLLLMEPSSHVTAQNYARTLEIALAAGFNAVGTPRIFRSRTTLLERP